MSIEDSAEMIVIRSDLDHDNTEDSNDVSDKANVSNEFDDLLPSFEMHNYMFNRTLTDDLPPAYQESITDTLTSSTQHSESVPSLDASTLNPANFVLNNLHKLQKISLPFDVKVTLTEKLPQFNMPYERRNPLKQYLPGEMVFGFAVFENKSTISLPFEMLLVSMECEVGVTHPKNNRQIIKKVLKMYDLEASYNFLDSDSYACPCDMLDPSDNTRLGFVSRVLEPGVRVKKFFKFRIPHTLLDDKCSEQFSEHLKLVPSFGLNAHSLGNTASAIDVDSHLGYGRLNRAGSPIKVNDYALPGEFCSYFINIQIIGKRLEAYKQFYTRNTTHQYDFIFLKNVEHYFRVGKNVEALQSSPAYGPTTEQLKVIEKTAQEAIEVLTEREMLKEIDITNIYDQDEIIFSSNGKAKASSDTLCHSSVEKQPLDMAFKDLLKFNFKKDLFSKINGELTVLCKLDRGTTAQSFLPKMMEIKDISVLTNEEFMKHSSPVLNLELTYKPSGGKGDKKLPTSICITPVMIAVDVQSALNIPFTIDDDFIRQDAELIKAFFKKFSLYYAKIAEMMVKLETGIPKTTSELLKGMAYVRYSEIKIPNVFKPVNLDISTHQWGFDSESQSYKFKTKVSLEYDVRNVLLNPKALLPSFQSCNMARLYKINVSIAPKRAKAACAVYPVTVI